MANDDSSKPAPNDRADLQKMFDAAASGLSMGEIEDMLMGMFASGGGGLGAALGAFDERPMPSRRRPRRSDVVTYRVRIDLEGAKPPLWRRLDLASDLFLDRVHQIIQMAFGWTNSHLHQFDSGPHRYGPETESYLCPFQADEGEAGVPEDQVRLDEVLVETGDNLFYTYDFGDNWEHTIKLEAVAPRADDAPRAVCTAGRRPGPPEDCGGVWMYGLIAVATDINHPDHAEALVEFDRVYGDDIEPEHFDVVPFDMCDVNKLLADIGQDATSPSSELPGPLADLVSEIRMPSEKRELQRLLGDAHLDEPVDIDAETAQRMVHDYVWMFDRVGDDGIKLTSAGYLPPVHVSAAVSELGLADEWISKGNRENQTLPVLNLRESAQKMGLLRKHRGALTLTAVGRRVRTDPVALWWQLAVRMPLTSTDAFEYNAGMLLLVAVAANTTADPKEIMVRLLNAIGWRTGDRDPITGSVAAHGAWGTKMVLRRLGALDDARGIGSPATPTADGVMFARAALRTWS